MVSTRVVKLPLTSQCTSAPAMGWLSKKVTYVLINKKTKQNFTIQKLVILICLLIQCFATEDEVTKEKIEEDIEDALLSVKELKGFLGISRKVEESNNVSDEKGKK